MSYISLLNIALFKKKILKVIFKIIITLEF